MNTRVKPFITVAISILSSALTVLLLIPGNQGESILSQVIEMLKLLVSGS